MIRPWKFYAHLILAFVALRGVSGDDNAEEGDYYQRYFEVCKDETIEVEDVSLLCDSPGAYYYGNGKYRNSETCALGDKGHVSIYFYIGEEMMGYEPYVTLKVKSNDGSMEDAYIAQDEQLCSLSGLSSQDGQACPAEGFYYLKGTVYLGNKDGNSNSLDVVATVGFRSDPEVGYFDLGGANTDYCEGGSYGKYSYAKMRKQIANAVASFLVTWGTLFFGVIAVVAFGVFLVKRIRNRNDVAFEEADEDLLDGHFNQVIVMSSSRSLVDF
ncbi:expressed unknown protein [Seminavis robusta]|uniref:Uncharacterized protein n=1 Tax=Seminavis robusta TaxID=568900 RepID=A0A9N8E067_9STRA|nr:expressed unknown protein [Seminavis robusta]|eukprot:Sro381_g130790.1 n/a (270) ;mRNA; r:21730-22539